MTETQNVKIKSTSSNLDNSNDFLDNTTFNKKLANKFNNIVQYKSENLD